MVSLERIRSRSGELVSPVASSPVMEVDDLDGVELDFVEPEVSLSRES